MAAVACSLPLLCDFESGPMIILLTKGKYVVYTVSMKTISAFKLSKDAKDLLRKLSKHLGVSMTATLELAIRMLAKKERIEK